MDVVRRILGGIGRQPYLVLGLAALGWGGNTIAGRLAVGEVSPMAIVALRWLVALLILSVLARHALRAQWPLLVRHAPFMFAMGALGFTVFNALFYWAAGHTSAVNLGVVQGITPALVIAGSFLAYRVPIRALQVIGIVVTLVGVAVMACRGDVEVLRHLAFNVGDLGMVLGSVLYAGYTVALRDRPPIEPLAFFTAMAAAAFVTSLPLLGYEIAAGTVIWPGARGWLIILFIGLGPSLVCQLLYMRGVQLIGPSRAGLFMNLIPPVSAVLGVGMLGESFETYHAVALVAVVGGIWLAERRA